MDKSVAMHRRRGGRNEGHNYRRIVKEKERWYSCKSITTWVASRAPRSVPPPPTYLTCHLLLSRTIRSSVFRGSLSAASPLTLLCFDLLLFFQLLNPKRLARNEYYRILAWTGVYKFGRELIDRFVKILVSILFLWVIRRISWWKILQSFAIEEWIDIPL